jgi:hypothetical protein
MYTKIEKTSPYIFIHRVIKLQLRNNITLLSLSRIYVYVCVLVYSIYKYIKKNMGLRPVHTAVHGLYTGFGPVHCGPGEALS